FCARRGLYDGYFAWFAY
nr:immunoglobulin heavy chain junction region [Mus musculus]